MGLEKMLAMDLSRLMHLVRRVFSSGVGGMARGTGSITGTCTVWLTKSSSSMELEKNSVAISS